MITAGDWGNDSVSHNTLPGALEPNVTDVGGPRRYMLFPDWTNVSGNSVTVNGIVTPYAYLPPPSIAAWQIPPGSTNAFIDATLPANYQQLWIPFTNPPPTPTPWTGIIIPTTLTDPNNGLSVPLGVRLRIDNDGTGAATYFDVEAVVTLPGPVVYRSSLQAEYR